MIDPIEWSKLRRKEQDEEQKRREVEWELRQKLLAAREPWMHYGPADVDPNYVPGVTPVSDGFWDGLAGHMVSFMRTVQELGQLGRIHYLLDIAVSDTRREAVRLYELAAKGDATVVAQRLREIFHECDYEFANETIERQVRAFVPRDLIDLPRRPESLADGTRAAAPEPKASDPADIVLERPSRSGAGSTNDHAEETDGPKLPNAFVWKGESHQPLPRTAFRLVNYLWVQRSRTARFDDLAGPVWGDHAKMVTSTMAGSARREANRFFESHGIPMTVSVHAKNECVSLQDRPT
jgi:hypothetical protein